ncbi:tRNA (N6-isopentenyl adenosine(37)-C2)-methylthiotransferase MiaB [Oceanirhabdus sp. W0125-5]|uniref:tRNA (N6-isopentenyl adenosine(37)-C2)-methylthiotransferase MiaB n=1 Tax=Oceanirhabdus sp. W0125-5 TaxID=2999116 RepID=UPI0022F2C52F|nr:tRNA (N6-isopentenyl adenosine(37)-C2)-methylthiotransferase MiaB [Oceanirhabdus sp. W0125-5]WBW95108.1 tRNA (N6-isopentenyl adenosine(37)-C2)-methylthiotransferase MiaB [Oceanirhabdus sp. W0125-5]
MLKYYIETWGCQMNEEDSEKISGMLKIKNYTYTKNRKEADIIIFNTCCVRENAELKVYGHLGALKKLKMEKPELVIAVTGCMMQQPGMKDEVIKKFPYVDIIIGTHNSYKFPEYLTKVLSGERPVLEIWDKEKSLEEIESNLPIDRKNPYKAFVTIMYGCNNFCTYCIVPHVRGRERSRKPEDIINEIKELVSKGYKEVTLLGQNVNSYGKGLNDELSFADLLRMINKIDGLERVRFMTSHPKDLSDDVIDAIAECDKLCEQIHLPVQSGSSNILKRMNRHYTKESYLELVEKIKNRIPNVALTTDLIVGFPGETEEDFEETLDLCKKVEYDAAYTFLYSKRTGTPAAEYENQVPEDVKHERFNRLLDVINERTIKNNLEYKDRTVEVLVEGTSKNNDTMLMGRTRNGRLVNFSGSKDSIGQIVNVKITSPKSFSLMGEQV